ncbi:MAG: carboxylating nicotinate-nucleotide diphosphorylase [Ilumatobacteraceae bacterium]|jgi:nicotinate-nucleotide pyrophosphorylase (carboxylating)
MQYQRISDATASALTSTGLSVDEVRRVIARALDEDFADGPDVTTNATVPADHVSRARFVSRAQGCVAGVPIARAVLEMMCSAESLNFEETIADGASVKPGDLVISVTGPTRGLLTAERTALNLLGHLSGIATATQLWALQLAETNAKVRDTRKTLPGLRALQKYAVRCGGGVNHRMSLGDAALVKDNHVVAAGGVAEAFARVRSANAAIPVEVEVDTLEQLTAALEAGADLVLLDNMSPTVMREAVNIAKRHRESTGRDVILEASGGLSLGVARAVAETGVDYISVGGLTHSVTVLDIGLDLEDVSTI